MNFLKAIRPIAMDFLSTIVFVLIASITDDIRLAIIIGVGTGAAQIGWQIYRGRKPSLMEWMSLAVVAASGTASLVTDDPRFVMIKPTLSYVIIGCVMMVPGWMTRYIPARAVELVPDERFVMWGYVWAGLMFVSAIFNLVLVFGLKLSVADWGTALTFWGLGTKLSLFLVQYAMIRGEARRNALSREGDATALSSLSLARPQ